MTATTITKNQTKTFGPVPIKGYAKGATFKVLVRYDDSCGNGHNTFAITAEVREPRRTDIAACGCMHDKVAVLFPELAHLIKWHLCSTDGPMHYIANTTYWAKEGNLEYARSTAIWPDATLDDLEDAEKLAARLPGLLGEFRSAVESLGFTY